LQAERVRSLGALRSRQSKKKLAAARRRETHFQRYEAKEECVENSVEREIAVGRKGVEDAETAIEQAQEEMRNAENAGLTTTKPETTFEEMLNAIGDGLNDLACSDDGEDVEDEDDDEDNPELGKHGADDEPGWVMGTICKTVQHRMERFRQKQIKLDELMQPGWGDAADHFRERDRKYGTTELKVPVVVQLQREEDVICSAPTACGEPIETLDINPGKSEMPQVTS